MTEFTEHTPRKRLSKGFRRFVTIAAALVVTGGAGVGAATASGVFTVGGAGTTFGIECHARADNDSPSLNFSRNEQDPVAACRHEWRRHTIPGSSGPPPHLVACIQDNGGVPGNVVVFPGTTRTCKQLGLAVAKPPTREELAHMRDTHAVTHDLEQAYVTRCVSDDQLVPVARAALKRHHLAGWTVKDEFRDGESRCAMAYVDEQHDQVVVDNGR